MPDWKPAARIKDPELLKRFRLEHVHTPCESCEHRPGIHVHHLKFRSQGGDDVESNLSWLCGTCHAKAHGLRAFLG